MLRQCIETFCHSGLLIRDLRVLEEKLQIFTLSSKSICGSLDTYITVVN